MPSTLSLATHDGPHHADDVVATALLFLLKGPMPVRRTRNREVIAESSLVVDVGGCYCHDTGRYDHHQATFQERDPETAILLSSAGLVWRHHGPALVRLFQAELGLPKDDRLADEVWALFQREVIGPIDAIDNGVTVDGPLSTSLMLMLPALNPTLEDLQRVSEGLAEAAASNARAKLHHARFLEAVAMAERLVEGSVKQMLSRQSGINRVLQEMRLEDDGLIAIVPPGNWREAICQHTSAKVVLCPHISGREWSITAVPLTPGSFNSHIKLPAAWAGLEHEALAQVCGCPDAIFAHKGRWLAKVSSFESALKMARAALAQAQEQVPEREHA